MSAGGPWEAEPMNCSNAIDVAHDGGSVYSIMREDGEDLSERDKWIINWMIGQLNDHEIPLDG